MKLVLLITLIISILYNFNYLGRFSIKKKSINFLMLFILWLFGASLFYIGDMFSGFTSYVGALVQFFEVVSIGIIIVDSFSREDFLKCYVHILFTICCISLVYFFLTGENKALAVQLAKVYESGSSKYMALPWYTFGWQTTAENSYVYSYVFGRNAGPWWEPGAFQGFILIAMFALLNYRQLFKRKALLMCVFMLTILTTQSTTAFLCVLISLLAYSREYVDYIFGNTRLSKKSNRMKATVYVASAIFVVLISYIIISSGNISEKFISTNGSYFHRMKDIQGTLSLLIYNPIAGIGLGKTGKLLRAATVSTSTATTLLTLAMYFGIPFATFYYYRFVKGCFSIFQPNSFVKKIVLVVVFTIILMSETLYMLPIYAVFLFKWRSDKQIESVQTQ